MTDADRDGYRRQMEAATKRLPRGHVINHVTWRDGHLTVQSAKPERVAKEPDAPARVRRGATQEDLFA